MRVSSGFLELLLTDNRSRWVIGLSTLVFLIIWLMPELSYQFDEAMFASYHIIFETIAIAIAVVIFSVCWHARLFNENSDPIVLIFAAGFFVVAVFDLAHMLSYMGMPDWITPSDPNKAIHFWFAARYADAIAILLLVIGGARLSGIKVLAPIMITFALLYIGVNFWLQFWQSDWLPVFYIEGSGLTASKITLEWGIIVIHLITLFILAHKHLPSDEYDLKLIATAIWLTILSELCFTLYSHVNDIFNFLGHFYKIGAYLFLYLAVVRGSIKQPYTLLRENKELLQQITDNIHQVFWLASADFSNMLYVSPAYEKIWGRSRESLSKDALSWVESIHPEDKKRVVSSLEKANAENVRIEFRIIRPDGETRWLRNHCIPVFDSTGLLQRITGITEDITYQVKSSESLKTSEARLRAILKTASDGMHIVNKHGTLIDASASFLEQVGYDESAVGHLKVWEWATDYDKDSVEKTIHELIASGETVHFETLFKHRNGHTFFADVYLRAFRIGEEALIYSSARDISDRKQAEADREQLQHQLFQAQKMESIGQLTGGIAHDFNNILNAIIGYTDLLKLELETGNEAATTEKRSLYIENVLTAGWRAQELIAQMLIFSRIDKITDATAVPTISLDM